MQHRHHAFTVLLLGFLLPYPAPPAVWGEQPPRNDIHISGVYPHLTTYGIYSQNGGHYKAGHNECGIGAIVPWAGKLWMVNYAPHMPRGSEHKLYSISEDLKMLTIHPESVGGTPAGRMIHRESIQLLIGHHLIDAKGKVRTISPGDMPIRVTAIARHLTDPVNMVYYVDMEGSIWEANVHTLAVKRLFQKPVPGWHAKGGYTGQGRLVVSNNGELAVGNYKDVLVGGPAKNEDEAGVLAEWDGKEWRIVERRQFTEVTGPQGIGGGGDEDDPIWAVGWDRRSLRLKLLEAGKWHTYLLPKAALCNDARHGWYTEWPRIREITDGKWMMDMHGMFFNFPKSFSTRNSAGLAPIGSHLRYIPDFCGWNGKVVLATDETSIQGNNLAGQPQSNLWFGTYEDLKSWGPASGYGGPWIEDRVTANTPSDPFLVAGFDRRVVHLATGRNSQAKNEKGLRASDQQAITDLPQQFRSLPRVTVKRGDWHKPAAGFSFTVDQPVTVFLAVDQRGGPKLDSSWKRTDMTLTWGERAFQDAVYSRDFPPGTIAIPGNATRHTQDAYGMPHIAFVLGKEEGLAIKAQGEAKVTLPTDPESNKDRNGQPVVFSLQIDVKGDGRWVDYKAVTVPDNGYVCHLMPDDFNATWLRVKTDRDCTATVILHQTAGNFANGKDPRNVMLFAGLAPATASDCRAALVYPAKRNRNLRVITGDNRYFDFTKAGFEFQPDQPDEELEKLLKVEPDFTVDNASVIVKHRGKNLRLPKGSLAFDKPFASGWPRASREVESERHLANIHGTFYEVPLITNGQPPAFDLMRPVCSHDRQITDFCSWNGLLVLAGVSPGAANDGHVFADDNHKTALWFGGVDDLWKLGKPVGHGGPWKDTAVKAGQPSDPFLMTGYDRKTLTLSADTETTVTVEIDFDHQSGWHRYKTFDLRPNQPEVYVFPPAFSAHWIRFVASDNCTATAQLRYE